MENRQIQMKVILKLKRWNKLVKQSVAEFMAIKFVVIVDNKITSSAIIPKPDKAKMSQISVVLKWMADESPMMYIKQLPKQ